MKHIKQLEEDIKDLSDQLKYKEKRRNQAASSRNYKVCDQLTEEMHATVKKQKRECEEELSLWNKGQATSQLVQAESTIVSEKSSAHSSDECDNDKK